MLPKAIDAEVMTNSYDTTKDVYLNTVPDTIQKGIRLPKL